MNAIILCVLFMFCF